MTCNNAVWCVSADNRSDKHRLKIVELFVEIYVSVGDLFFAHIYTQFLVKVEYSFEMCVEFM